MASAPTPEEARAGLEESFPGLTKHGYSQESPYDPGYNCIAWAAGDSSRVWWPEPGGDGYWPPRITREETLDAFIEAFRSLGYEPCGHGRPERRCEKIAIFVSKAGSPTHAARQLTSGRWASKMGKSVDIEHHLLALRGDEYGEVGQYMKRRRTETA